MSTSVLRTTIAVLTSSTAPNESFNSTKTEQSNLLNGAMAATNSSKKLPQYLAGVSAAGGALAMGTVLGWTSPAQKEVMGGVYGFPVSSNQFSWVGSAMTLGGAAVCIPIGLLCNWIGRKWTMVLLVLPFTIGWCLLIWPKNVAMLYAGRFILGLSGPAFCVTAPMYNAEIAEKDIRGTMGSFFQLMTTCGILFVYCLGAWLHVLEVNIVCGLLPIVNALLLLYMPQSPTYLVSKGKPEAAIKSIQWLRGKDYDYHAEIEELTATDKKLKEDSGSIGAALTRKVALKALSISLALMVFQQLSGINAVIFYSTDIFRDANTGMDAHLVAILVGVMQVCSTFCSAMVVDRMGRRILLIASAAVMALTTACMGVYFYMQQRDPASVKGLGWLPVCSVCLFIIMFSFGFGPIPWLMMSELFSSDIKGVASPIAGTANWLLAFTVTKSFLNLKIAIGPGKTFWLFSAVEIVGVLFVLFLVPETKGKSLNEIQAILAGKKGDSATPAAALPAPAQ